MSSIDSEHPSPEAIPRRPIVELTLLALPTVLQMLAYTVEQFTDALMLSRVSDTHATAAGMGGGICFAIISFGFGVLVVTNALVSHHYGAKRDHECGSQLWQAIYFAVGFAVLLLPTMWLAPWIFGRVIRHEPSMVVLEVAFFNVLIAFTGLKLVAVAFGEFLIAINRPTVVLIAASAGLPVNVCVNWLLIYGHAGFPKLGVAGAAWGTNCAVLTELLIVGTFAFGPTIRKRFRTTAFQFERQRFGELMRVGIPSGFQVAGDVMAWVLFFNVVIGRFGTTALAASNYMVQYMKITFMPAFGLGAAVTALVARYHGAGKPDIGDRRAHLGFAVAAVYVVLCGIGFITFRHPLIGFFTHDPEIIRVGGTLMIVCAAFQLFDAMLIIYTGALRGVKDTFVPAIVQIALCWTLMVGCGLTLSWLRPDWGPVAPWSMGLVYCFALGLFLLTRFRGHAARRARLA